MNLYDLLNDSISLDQRISSSLFNDNSVEMLTTEKDKKLYFLIKNICSLTIEEKNNEVHYVPAYINYEANTRSYSPKDFKEEDLANLVLLDFNLLPLNIKARLADFLWVEKREYQFAKIAQEAYLDLFNKITNIKKWHLFLNYIKRALHISTKIKDISHKEECIKILKNKILNLSDSSDIYIPLRLTEVLIPNLDEEIQEIEFALDDLITRAKNIAEIEEIYKVKIKYYTKFKKQNEKDTTNKLLADELVNFAETMLSQNESNVMRCVAYLKKAISIYRNSKNTQLAEKVHRRLITVQKMIPNHMHVHSQKIDLKENVKIIENIFKKKTFEETILLLGEFTPIYKKDYVKSLLIENHYKNPLSSLFSQEIINNYGQTICVLNPLSYENPEQDLNLLEHHIHHKMYLLEENRGNFVIRLILQYIRQHHKFKYGDLEFIVKDNLIIPEGRNNIFQKGLYLALCGQNYEAIHILAPQMENLFRNLAHELGGLTSTLDSDGQAKEKTLTSIFETQELLDSYDNDILFLLKGLLNEPSGGNIRNEIAHGILNESKSFNGACLYFIGICFKLLSFTCPTYIEYFQNKQSKEE